MADPYVVLLVKALPGFESLVTPDVMMEVERSLVWDKLGAFLVIPSGKPPLQNKNGEYVIFLLDKETRSQVEFILAKKYWLQFREVPIKN